MSIILDTITLPNELQIINEFEINQNISKKFSVSGKMYISRINQSGKPLKLGSEHAWIIRSDLLELYDLCNNHSIMLLTLHDSTQYIVSFDENPFDVEKIINYADISGIDKYRINALNLIIEKEII